MTGADGLGVAGVGADQRRVEVGLVEDLALPLLDGRGAGGQDQGLGLQRRHGRQADDRLAGAAGQDDDARAAADVAAGVEGVDGPLLVVADLKRQARQRRLPERRAAAPRRRCSRPGPRPDSRRRSGPA